MESFQNGGSANSSLAMMQDDQWKVQGGDGARARQKTFFASSSPWGSPRWGPPNLDSQGCRKPSFACLCGNQKGRTKRIPKSRRYVLGQAKCQGPPRGTRWPRQATGRLRLRQAGLQKRANRQSDACPAKTHPSAYELAPAPHSQVRGSHRRPPACPAPFALDTGFANANDICVAAL